jgi:hypothetical protein
LLLTFPASGTFQGKEPNTIILLILSNPLILQSRSAETPVKDSGSAMSRTGVLKDEEMEENHEMIASYSRGVRHSPRESQTQ